jgi:hypothetical protein
MWGGFEAPAALYISCVATARQVPVCARGDQMRPWGEHSESMPWPQQLQWLRWSTREKPLWKHAGPSAAVLPPHHWLMVLSRSPAAPL